MTILIISSSFHPASRSRELAGMAADLLREQGRDARLISLSDYPLPPFSDGEENYDLAAFRELHRLTDEAGSLILASPVYNWGCCAELKKYLEYVGSTSSDGRRRGGFFDKVVTIVLAAGLPHSFMAAGAVAQSLMLDFKCVINPYQAYVHNQDWAAPGALTAGAQRRLERALGVHVDLAARLDGRDYSSTWEV